MQSDNSKDSPTLFDIFEHDGPVESAPFDSNRERLNVILRVIPNDSNRSQKSDEKFATNSYRIWVHTVPNAHVGSSDTIATNTDTDANAQSRPPLNGHDLNIIRDRHESLISFAPYLRSLLDKLTENMPTDRFQSAVLECYDHVSKCKAALRWNHPLESGSNGARWDGVIKNNCKTSSSISFREGANDLGYDPVIRHDPSDQDQDLFDRVMRISRLNREQQVDPILSRLFDHSFASAGPLSPDGSAGRDRDYRLDQQRLLLGFTIFHGYTNPLREDKITKPSREEKIVKLRTGQIFSETEPAAKLGSEIAGKSKAWPVPGVPPMEHSKLDDVGIEEFVKGIPNSKFIPSLTHEDYELTQTLRWCDGVTQMLPFRPGPHEGEDMVGNTRELSRFNLDCDISTLSAAIKWPTKPIMERPSTFKVNVSQWQYRCREDIPDVLARQNHIGISDERFYRKYPNYSQWSVQPEGT